MLVRGAPAGEASGAKAAGGAGAAGYAQGAATAGGGYAQGAAGQGYLKGATALKGELAEAPALHFAPAAESVAERRAEAR